MVPTTAGHVCFVYRLIYAKPLISFSSVLTYKDVQCFCFSGLLILLCLTLYKRGFVAEVGILDIMFVYAYVFFFFVTELSDVYCCSHSCCYNILFEIFLLQPLLPLLLAFLFTLFFIPIFFLVFVFFLHVFFFTCAKTTTTSTTIIIVSGGGFCIVTVSL